MNLMTEHRNSVRSPCNESIHFTIADNAAKNCQTISATVVDISPTGVGISTDLMLRKNQSINFSKNQPNWQLPEKGVIVWSYKQDSSYRAGVEFIVSEDQQ